jgi:hypothetical protein
MKAAATVLYLMIGLGFALSKPLTVDPPELQFAIRIAIWPATVAQEVGQILSKDR